MRTLIILFIIAGAGYWWHFRHERFTELEAVKSDRKSIERVIAERQKTIDYYNKTLEPLRKNQAESEKPGGTPEQLELEIDALKESLTAVTAQLDSAEAEFEAAVQAVRDHARGQTFSEVKLASGQVLTECSISKFGEGYVNITHKLGIEKVASEDLPQGWAAKYAVDYVNREAQAEKDALTARVEEATIAPLDLKKAKLEDIDARIDTVTKQLLAFSAQIRAATRKSDDLIRQAYRIALDKGQKGEAAAAKRTAMFSQSEAVKNQREEIRKKYNALRAEKQNLERQRIEIVHRRPSQARSP